jgi:hypothetical protein
VNILYPTGTELRPLVHPASRNGYATVAIPLANLGVDQWESALKSQLFNETPVNPYLHTLLPKDTSWQRLCCHYFIRISLPAVARTVSRKLMFFVLFYSEVLNYSKTRIKTSFSLYTSARQNRLSTHTAHLQTQIALNNTDLNFYLQIFTFLYNTWQFVYV